MRPGTNTALLAWSNYDPHIMPEKEVIRLLHEAGFETLDFSLAYTDRSEEFFLARDDWQQEVDRIADTAAKYGMVFSQVHLPFHKKGWPGMDPNFSNPGYAELFEECTRRAYIAGGMVGAPWAVAHCLNPIGIGFDRKKAAEINHEHYDKYVELGIKNGIGTAFENMIQGTPQGQHFRYSSHPDDLIDYVDSYNDPMVGICWDFGHAYESGLEQPVSLRKVGKRLKCVHVDDNFQVKDVHIIPFCGQIDWMGIIPVLAEIGYEGDLSLEVGPTAKRAPRDLQPVIAKFACDICRYLCGVYDKAKQELEDK